MSIFHKALAVERVYYSLLVVRCLPKCILQIKYQVCGAESQSSLSLSSFMLPSSAWSDGVATSALPATINFLAAFPFLALGLIQNSGPGCSLLLSYC